MKKTSVYLDEEHLQQLRWVAQREGRSQAEVVREAIVRYAEEAAKKPDRNFLCAAIAQSLLGGPISAIPEEELLKGFGDDAYSGRWADHHPDRRVRSAAAGG